MVNHNKLADRTAFAGDGSFGFLPYQLWMVGYWPTMALTGNGKLGFIPEREPERRLPHPRKAAGA